jgi:hypothetical protein
MPTRQQCAAAGFVMIAALSLSGCGGSSTTEASTGSSTPSTTVTGTPRNPAGATVVVRSGGIAGVRDMVRIAADGTARLTSKTGTSRACAPSAASLDRLATIDLTGLKGIPSAPSHMADGFNYLVQTTAGTASASEGDANGRRAELVSAAAAVIGSCLATQS